MVVVRNGSGAVSFGVPHFYPLGTKVEVIDDYIDSADCVTCINVEEFQDLYHNTHKPYTLRQRVRIDYLEQVDKEGGGEV